MAFPVKVDQAQGLIFRVSNDGNEGVVEGRGDEGDNTAWLVMLSEVVFNVLFDEDSIALSHDFYE